MQSALGVVGLLLIAWIASENRKAVPWRAIGAGINATYDNVLTGSATLAGIGVAPAGIATSSFRITWLVPDERVKDAVRALHERYIEQQRPLVP